MIAAETLNGHPCRVLVEDEALIAMLVEDMIHDMCGRPLRSKRNLQERCRPWSGADMCAAFDAAHMPRAQMGVRRSGPSQAHALEALVAKLVFLIRSLDRAPSLSCDRPTPRQPRGRDGAYTAATGARYTPPLASSAQTIRAILLASATRTSIGGLRASMRPSHEPAGAPFARPSGPPRWPR